MQTTNILQVGVAGNWMTRRGIINAYAPKQSYYKTLKYKNLNIEFKHVKPLPIIGGGPALINEMLFKNVDKYKILHNLSTHPFWLLKDPKGTKTITTAHEMQYILYPEFNEMLNRSLKDKLWQRTITIPGIKCLLASDYAAATSSETKAGLLKAGFPKDKIFLIHLGLDNKYLQPIRPKAKKQFTIGTIGTAGVQKNTSFSITAVNEINNLDIKFEIWGKSIYSQKQLQDMTKGDTRIKLMGPAPASHIVKVYDSFDVFVFPSLFEGFGIPLIESQSRGLPVIIWKESKIAKELKKYCIIAKDEWDMAQKIMDIKDNGYNEKERKKAMAYARKFTLVETGKKIMKAYETILSDL